MTVGPVAKLVGILILIFCSSPALWSQAGANAAERQLFQAANKERKAQGLPALQWNPALASAARAHAKEMAGHNEVSHRLPGEAALPSRATRAGAHFHWLSENVVQARTAAEAHAQFVKSPAHRGNLLDRDMNVVGIGVVVKRSQLFVVQDFAQAK